jgi:hypothetical protein
MSIKKSLLAMAVTALALMGFASSAMGATDGVIRDVDGGVIQNGVTLHMIGWTKFSASVGSYQCHETVTIEMTGTTGTTGDVKSMTIPNLANCTGTGFLAGCKLTSAETKNLPYHVTVTPTDLDVTGTIVKVTKYSSCLIAEQTTTFSEITFKPLKTGPNTITGVPAGTGHLGTTAANGEPIAGFEYSGSGTVNPGGIAITVTGELELTSPERCTYKLESS